MSARADAVAGTRKRILEAAYELLAERDFADVPLSEVADRAHTTVQTILRHYATRDGVVDALIRRETSRVRADREQVPVGDVDAAIAYLARHYREEGDATLGLLAAERRSDAAAHAVATGRHLHREWVARTFAPSLERLTSAARRRRRLEQLVAVTDVFTWKLMCRDGGLDDRQYRLALRELLTAIEGAS